jgi:hypothetical protein
VLASRQQGARPAQGQEAAWNDLGTDEREIQHALDGGATVLVVLTVDTDKEAKQAVQRAYLPTFGRRSQGGSQVGAVLPPRLPAGVNYRRTFNSRAASPGLRPRTRAPSATTPVRVC